MGKMTLLGAGGAGVAPVFTPLDISNLRAWYKGGAGVTLNGATVSQWDDQSGNGNNLIQATATKQPTFVSSGLNGLPTLSFDGVDDGMSLPATITGFTNLTYYVVYKINGTRTNAHILSVDGTNLMLANWRYDVGTMGYKVGGYYFQPVADVPDVFTVIKLTATGTTAHLWRNSSDFGTGTIVNSQISTFKTLCDNTSGEVLNGEVAEVLIYDKVLSVEEIALMDLYLHDKYNVF